MSKDYTGHQSFSFSNYPKKSALSGIAAGVGQAFSDYSDLSVKNARYLSKYGQRDAEGNLLMPPRVKSNENPSDGEDGNPGLKQRKPGSIQRDPETGKMMFDINQDFTAGDAGRLAGAGLRAAGRGIGRLAVRGGAKAYRSFQGRIGKGAGQSQEFDPNKYEITDENWRD